MQESKALDLLEKLDFFAPQGQCGCVDDPCVPHLTRAARREEPEDSSGDQRGGHEPVFSQRENP